MQQGGLFSRVLVLSLLPTAVLLPIISCCYCFAVGDDNVPPKIANLQAWLSGHANFWTRNLEGGTLQLGATSNPMTLLDVLFLCFEPHVASNITQLFQVTLGGVGFFLWRLFEKKQSKNASFLGACTYELCHFALARLSIGHEIVTIQHGLFPWALWLIDRLAGGSWRMFFFIFPWIFLQMALSGVPQQTIPLALVMGAYLLFRLKQEKRPVPKPVLIGVGCLALGLALAAFVYYPGFMFSRHAVLPGTPEYNIKDYQYHISFPWVALIQLICPYFFGEDVTMRSYASYFSPENTGSFHEFAIYGGLFSAIVPFLFLSRIRESREMIFWLVCGVGILLISFGKWGGIYIPISRLPMMENFRGPARFLIAMPAILSVFAAFGMACVEKSELGEIKKILRKLCFVILALLGLSVVYWILAQISWENFIVGNKHFHNRLEAVIRDQVRPASWLNLKQMLLVSSLLPVLMMIGRFDKQRAIVSMMVFHVLELVINAYPLMDRSGGIYRSYTQPDPFTRMIHSLTDQDESRFIDSVQIRPALISMFDGTRATAAYRNLHLRWYLELIYAAEGRFGVYDTYDYTHRNATSPISRLMRARVLLSRDHHMDSEWEKICAIGDVNVYERKNIPPQFYFAKKIRVEPDRLKRLKILADPNRDPLSECLIESSLPDPLKISSPPIKSFAWKTELSAHIKYDPPGSGILCTDLTYYPRWRAFDQNEELSTIRINHGFLGIVTRSNSSEIDLEFDAKDHRIGLWISVVALGVWTLLFSIFIINRRKKFLAQ